MLLLFSYFCISEIVNAGNLYFRSVKIITTFFLLWITTQFQTGIENLLAYIFILTLGILHGSNDIKLIQKFNSNTKYHFKKLLLIYVAIVLTSVIFFAIIPQLALPFFLLLSAYHFGEQHLSGKLQLRPLLKSLVYSCYGFVIFFIIFFTNAEATALIIKDISGISLGRTDFYTGLILSLSILTISISILALRNKIKMNLWEELLYLGLFFITFANASLLWSFAIYFIIWHALPSLKDQVALLYGTISKMSLKRYLRSSILYWVISVLGIYILHLITNGNERLFNQLFFSFIAAVTFPHVLVIHNMYNKASSS
ncbi:MAG: Brp/Blh family beta-carotene 15,15'-dioxygenase [Flavobacteriaceae bacterium]|nr:Brp/Blh family beta-carotene 15,15'-dioxygenase [Flavobacteriaceae bacterium]